MKIRFRSSLFKTVFLCFFLLFMFTVFVDVYAQTDTISGSLGVYSFGAGSYDVVSRADNMFSPVEIVSEGHPPSSTYTYVAEDNGYLSVKFVPTAGNWVYLKVNGEVYGYGLNDGFGMNVQLGETVTFTISPPAYQTDYELVQDEVSHEVTFTDTFSWNNTAGVINYNLTVAEVPEVEFSWYPRQPVRGEDVTIYTSMNTMTLNSMTWYINDVVVDYAQDSSQWTLSNIQDGVYEVTLRVEDQYGVTGEKTYTITVGERQVFYGVVFDDLGNRYQDLSVSLYWDGVYQDTTWTDEDGYYEFTEINGQPITLPLNGMGEVKIEFVDKDHMFEIRDIIADKTQIVSVTYPVTSITSADKLEFNIGFYGDMVDDPDTPLVNEELTDDHALIFYYTDIAKRFYAEKLGFHFLNKPLYILTNDTNTDEAYFQTERNPQIDGKTTYPMIYYTSPVMKRTSQEAPQNREFHEFSHYAMWDEYGGLPEWHYQIDFAGGRKWLDNNHGGIQNHCTSDSYVEAFAEFMALVINKEMNIKAPVASVLPDFAWSRYPIGAGKEYLEYNRQQKHKFEELCFASVLWDLYDGVEVVDSDNVDLSLEQVWAILSQSYVSPKYYQYNSSTKLTDKLDEQTTEVRNIYYIIDLYGALIEKAPLYAYTANDIDAIFVSHRIFNDTNADGVWQQGEPVGLNLTKSSERRKQPVDESWLLTIDIPESMLPMDIHVTTTNGGQYTQYDHEYTVTVYDYPIRVPIIMPPEKYAPEMTVEVVKQGYTDTNPLVLDVNTYNDLVATQGSLGSYTPSLDTGEAEYIIVKQLDAPATAKTGSTISITATLEYNFNEITLINLGVYDYATDSYVFEETYWVQGTDVEDYLIQLTAPDSAQTLELEANVIFQQNEAWYYTEGDEWYSYFTIEVTESTGGIPGYHMLAILGGFTASLLIIRRQRTQPSI